MILLCLVESPQEEDTKSDFCLSSQLLRKTGLNQFYYTRSLYALLNEE
jgi:hypothetical protein